MLRAVAGVKAEGKMAYENLIFERRGAVAVLTLNRPQRANAMDRALLGEMQAACDEVEANEAIRAAVLTGAGNAFCSGFDLKEQMAAPPQGVAGWRPVLRQDFDAVMRFWRLSKPTVAAVRGLALASGFELACACDLTVAADDAIFGEPELKFGAGIVVMIFPFLVGAKLAKELILTANDRIPAKRAYEMGLVNRLVPGDAVLDEAVAVARNLASMDPGLVRQTKAAINRAYDLMGMGQALEMALDVDLQIEGEGTAVKREFLRIAREQGLRAAIAWRDSRSA
jgi:enoyl-CoA hydratase